MHRQSTPIRDRSNTIRHRQCRHRCAPRGTAHRACQTRGVADDSLLRRSVFRVPGMDCPTEEQLVRMALSEVTGIRSLDFDLGARELQAVHTGPPEPLLVALRPLGMGAVLTEATEMDPTDAGLDASASASP